ncbi:MAG: phosphate signaling complex protein PhoU [Roseiflexus sp.]|nr:phosphate signaling complex protein PhoU [Roseiflexus sp.]MCS7288208.1 phosphate signaling complex protein PhoU [Roseiflexus sp.]MDW8145935.1 phosphate signaling complex protein PhoU [Roseiflexaceae bacterium]MDW8232848.1 phosphate signaling complex protein PhoU [Roseiflexaceae bacterium]
MGALHSLAHDYDYLRHTLDAMARRVKSALHESLQALRRSDAIGAKHVIHDDPDINALQQDVEDLVVRFITQWQPLLRDLRRVLAMLMVASELERIGDYARQLAMQVRRAHDNNYPLLMVADLAELGALTEYILSSSIAAFLAEDTAAARAIAALDDQIDERRRAIIASVRQAALEDSSVFDAALASIEIARTLERVADRATNIAERTVYLVTATHEALNE